MLVIEKFSNVYVIEQYTLKTKNKKTKQKRKNPCFFHKSQLVICMDVYMCVHVILNKIEHSGNISPKICWKYIYASYLY